MSTLGDVQYIRGYHDACGAQKPFNLYWKPWCTEHLPMYSWYPPHTSWYPPDVLMKSLDVLVISPDVLMVSPQCTNGIPQCTEQPQYTGDTYRVFMPDEFLFHILLTADKILNQIKSKISSQPKMEKSMTQETAWFRTYAIRTDPPPSLQIHLLTVSCFWHRIGKSLNSDALWGLSPDHLAGAEFV